MNYQPVSSQKQKWYSKKDNLNEEKEDNNNICHSAADCHNPRSHLNCAKYEQKQAQGI